MNSVKFTPSLRDTANAQPLREINDALTRVDKALGCSYSVREADRTIIIKVTKSMTGRTRGILLPLFEYPVTPGKDVNVDDIVAEARTHLGLPEQTPGA